MALNPNTERLLTRALGNLDAAKNLLAEVQSGGNDNVLLKTNNLDDVTSAGTARTNLGLGTAAVLDVGTGADNVVQLDGDSKLPAVDGSALTNLPGGGGLVQVATAELTDAQIKALPTAPVQVVPAPGVGKIAIPIRAVAILDTTAGAYTNVTDASFAIGWGDIYAFNPVVMQGSLGGATVRVARFAGPTDNGTGTFDGNHIGYGPGELSSYENIALTIRDDWAGGTDYTDGNAANTLKVTTYYAVVDV